MEVLTPTGVVDEEKEDRIRLLKMTNRLTFAFGIWAGVVAVIGGLALVYLQTLQTHIDSFDKEHTLLLLKVERIDERQQSVLHWIAKREKEEESKQ